MENDHCITVTHFINPHLFWYKIIGGARDEQFHVLTLLEEKLQELYKNKPSLDHRCRPSVGDKVAVNFVAWNKYIRAEILQKAEFQQEEFIVWAIDYGFPLLTKKEYLHNMPGAFAGHLGFIHCGGMVNVEPGEQEYNIEESDLVMMKRDQWLQKPCEVLEKLLADASSINFVKKFETSDNHHWGDLIITNHKGHTFNARDYLLKTTHVMEVSVSDFRQTCLKLKTTNIAPWLSNDRNTKVKFNSIKHNIVEHSKQMNSIIVDEFAKRKVEDWQARNERKQIDDISDLLETTTDLTQDNTIDDVTFDDSVSVINDRKNFIGKAGALMKIKQKKYGSKNSLPPPPAIHSNAFQMDNVIPTSPNNLLWPPQENDFQVKTDKDAFAFSSQPENSSVSSSTNVSIRLQKLAELRVKHARTQHEEHRSSAKHHLPQEQELPLLSYDAVAASTDSSGTGVSLRLVKLTELRKKHARAAAEENKKLLTSPSTSISAFSQPLKIREKHHQNETVDCYETISHPTTLDSYPYHTLEQTTLLTLNDSMMDKTPQDTKSELSVKNARAKQLSALRKKLKSPASSLANDTFLTEATIHESPLASRAQYKESLKMIKQQNNMDKDVPSFDNMDFKLKPKSSSCTNENINFDEIVKAPLTSLLPTVKQADSQSAYDGLTMIPAGFDIARLQTYKDETNHWHRKKTTRYDRVPHDQTISSDEFLIHNTHDQSSSSSDFFQMKPQELPAVQPSNRSKQYASANNDGNILNSTVPSIINATVLEPLSCLQQRDSNKTFNVKGIDESFLPSEVSTTTNSTVPSVKTRKRRQLQSPTSQLTKIDRILMQHDIEKKLGNTNILDLKRINTSPKKSQVLDNASTTDSQSECNATFNTRVIEGTSSSGSLIPDKICNEKRLKEVSNYTTLMEVKHTEHLPLVEGERNIQTKFIDHLVLAHSSIPLAPIENIGEAPFLPEIHDEMRNMRVNKVYRIQVYSWSHVQRGNSLFVVNPAKSGKTWSYLPPLCSLVCYRIGTLKPSYGPVAIILVASSRHVELVYSYCRRLMCGLKGEAPTCVPSYGMRNFVETKIQLLDGCGILVTTPSSMLRLLHDNDTEPLFDRDRLQHIVIDDMDLMLSRAHEDFKKAVRVIFKMAKKSKYNTLSPQLIVTSRDWDGLMVGLISKSNQPLLLIGDFLEAAVYGRATLSVKLKSSAEKNDTILKFIKNIARTAQGLENRILIMCNEDDDVTDVMEFLQECGYPCLGYFNRSTDKERVTIDEWKNKISSQILVCTDARFCELKEQNVQNLIHYSMPTSWTQFTTRFSALARTYENFVSQNFEQPIVTTMNRNDKLAHSMILLDEDNSLQLPRLVDFLLKHNQTVPEEILAVSKRVLVSREETRIVKGALLCPHLLEFGECDETRCDNRHQLTRFDVIAKDDDIPCAGEIRLHILKVFSPTYYTARVLQHKPPNSTKWLDVRRSSEALKFTIQINVHYRNEDNLSLHWPPHLNDLCIYSYADNFRRARILFVPALRQKHTNVVQSNLKVTLKLIDDGSVISDVRCNQIFVCDDQFKDFPAQAIDIRLMKIVPFDNERSWDVKTTKQIQKWIMDDIKPKYVVQASINFSLANTIWVNNVVVMEKLTGINAYSQVVHLKKSLIEKNFAMIYKGDRKHVREIAEENDLLNCLPESKVENDESDLDYQSCHNDSTNLIKFSSSNDDTTNSSMASAKTGLEETEDGYKTVILEAKKKAQIQQLPSKVATHKDAEDWDELLNDGQQREEVYVPLRTNSNHLELPKCNETFVDDSENIQDLSTAITEGWSRLPLNELVKVEIGDEGENGNWENIFLQIIDTKSMNKFDDLKDVINRHINNEKANQDKQQEIYDFEPLHNCIVKYNNLYQRAKIHGIFGTCPKDRLYRFFLCDYACFTNIKAKELYNDFLYPTTQEIVTFMPYQAIHCTLVGIQWDRFSKRYQVTKEYLYACAVLERSSEERSSLNLYNLPIQSYKILIYECEKENDFGTAVLFNKILLDNGITVADEDTKHFLEYEIGIEDKSKSPSKDNIGKVEEIMDICDTNKKDSLFSYEEFLELAQNCEWNGAFDLETEDAIKDAKQSLMPPAVDDSKAIKNIENPKGKPKGGETLSESEIEEQGNCTSDSNSKKSSISLSSSDNSSCSAHPPPLKNLYKRPLTTWYENDCIIFLSINAPGVKDYLLEVKQKTVLFSAETDDGKLVLLLNLLGSVDSQYVSHEIKGLNVVVRLVKLVFEKWPRLLEDPIKYSWLKYNFDAFDAKEMEEIMPQQRLHTALENNMDDKCNNYYDDDSDSERDVFKTYNPIQNEDDCDPFS